MIMETNPNLSLSFFSCMPVNFAYLTPFWQNCDGYDGVHYLHLSLQISIKTREKYNSGPKCKCPLPSENKCHDGSCEIHDTKHRKWRFIFCL